MSALDKFKRSQVTGLPPRQPPSITSSKTRKYAPKKRDFTPVSWEEYFAERHDVKVDNNVFRVYESGKNGPVVLFLHGGGFSGLSWAVLSASLSNLITCRCAAIDLRGHGDSKTPDDTDLSAERLSDDVGEVIQVLYGDEPPPVILVGHSMGGAIAVHVAKRQLIPTLVGLVVIDVVEGTALDSLTSMQSFLRDRPKQFNTLENAIEWCVKTGQVRNIDSARVSMVGQVKRIDTDETATSELESNNSIPVVVPVTHSTTDTITEEDESISEESTVVNDPLFAVPAEQNCPKTLDSKQNNISKKYTWRIDLSQTEKYWRGWFEGLSNKFLSCDVPKMLLLAGIDRLDRELTVGQMQGKFQMQVLPHCGHIVHEDIPDRVSEVLAMFMIRHKVATPTSNFSAFS